MEQAKRKALWWITLGMVIGFGLSAIFFSIELNRLSSLSSPPQNTATPSPQNAVITTPLPTAPISNSQPDPASSTLKYAASASFQVKPLVTTTTPLTTTQPSSKFTEEDLERTIQRQILLVRSDRVIDAAVKDSDAFSRFRQEYSDSPKTVLLKRLYVARIPNTDLFQIAVRGNDRVEVARQTNALADAYYEVLHQIENDEYAKQMRLKQSAQHILEKKVQQLSDELDEFKQSHDLITIGSANQVKLDTLSSVSTELAKAQTEVVAAKANLEAIKKQVEAGTTSLSAQEKAQTTLSVAQTKVQDLMTRRDTLDQELKDLDKWLTVYKSRNIQLESQQKLLADLTREVLLMELASRGDVQQVVRFSNATTPEK